MTDRGKMFSCTASHASLCFALEIPSNVFHAIVTRLDSTRLDFVHASYVIMFVAKTNDVNSSYVVFASRYAIAILYVT